MLDAKSQKKTTMKRFLFSITSLAWLLLFPVHSFACSCNLDLKLLSKSEKKQVKIAEKEALAVFSGEVVELTYDEKRNFYYAKFKVLNSWKNVSADEVTVSGSTMCCLCDWVFKVGESYLIYAEQYDAIRNFYGASHCSRSQFLSDAEIDLNVLGKGKNRKAAKPDSVRPKNSTSEKPRGRVWPGLKSVGGDFQPQQVTVLTPATQRRCPAFYK
jgi:hypothetical protein